MGTLKGQNFRVFTAPDPATTHAGLVCVGMATSCTITETGNTEDASHKDITGMAALPTIVSKGWGVQVESLYVGDTAALLTSMKAGQPFLIMWDETNTTDNVTRVKAAFARQGMAFLNDATFTFDNRTNSVKSLQFTGNGALKTVPSATSPSSQNVSSFTKGQYVRLFLGSDNTATPAKCIASARTLSLHASLTLEDATTKDTDGDWVVQEPTGFNYDISTSALTRSGETISSEVDAQAFADIMDIFEAGNPVKWLIANVSGDNNRTKGSVICSGSVVITQLESNNPNRADSTFTAQLTGYGDMTVGS